jgi:hypothetical protein
MPVIVAKKDGRHPPSIPFLAQDSPGPVIGYSHFLLALSSDRKARRKYNNCPSPTVSDTRPRPKKFFFGSAVLRRAGEVCRTAPACTTYSRPGRRIEMTATSSWVARPAPPPPRRTGAGSIRRRVPCPGHKHRTRPFAVNPRRPVQLLHQPRRGAGYSPVTRSEQNFS